MAEQEQTVTRREAKELTRNKLIDAAIHILDLEGEAGLTTTNITRGAGIAQSSFYVHFVDVNDLLHSVIDRLETDRGRTTRRSRRLALEFRDDPERFRDMFRVPLLDMIAHPQILRITMRSRQDRSTPVGDWSRSLHEIGRRGLYDDLVGAGMPKSTAFERQRVEMLADGLIGLTETMAQGHIEGRYTDIEESVDMLIAFGSGAWRHIVSGNHRSP